MIVARVAHISPNPRCKNVSANLGALEHLPWSQAACINHLILPVLQVMLNGTAAPYHSHSIVPGGFDVMSYTTLFTPFTSLMMRVAVSPKNFMSKA